MAKPAIMNADEIGAKLSESIATLAKLQGFSEQTVTLAECGVILKTCVGRTKVAKPQAIERGARLATLKRLDLTRSAGPESVTINAGIRGPHGRVWFRTKKDKFQLGGQVSDDGQKFTPSKYHFKFENFIDIKEAANDYGLAIRRAMPAAQKAAGLARQSWVQIADDLGIILEDVPGGGASAAAIAKARTALASNGQSYVNGIGTPAYVENKSFVATMKNSLPYNVKAGLDSILTSTLAGRAKFFEQNVARGVFNSQAETVKKYPWLKLLGAPTGGDVSVAAA